MATSPASEASSLPAPPPMLPPLLSISAPGNAEYVQQELEQYLMEKGLHQILVRVVEKVLVDRPENAIDYIVSYLCDNFPEQTARFHHRPQPQPQQPPQLQHVDESMLSVAEADESMQQPGPGAGAAARSGGPAMLQQRRGSVSAAPLTQADLNAPLPTFAKTEAEVRQLRAGLGSYWITESLDETQLSRVVECMEPVSFPTGAEVTSAWTTTTADGSDSTTDHLYVVKSGSCSMFEGGKHVRDFHSGDGFGGEVVVLEQGDSSLPNTPSGVTVVVSSPQPATLWRLDRTSYRAICANAVLQKRAKYVAFLSRVPFLQSLSEKALVVLADTLQPKQFAASEVVVAQGASGSHFFIIEQGNAEVVHNGQVVDLLHAGDYFGEIALLEASGVRNATVRVPAKHALLVLVMRREVFHRVLGPLKDVLRNRVPSYRRSQPPPPPPPPQQQGGKSRPPNKKDGR